MYRVPVEYHRRGFRLFLKSYRTYAAYIHDLFISHHSSGLNLFKKEGLSAYLPILRALHERDKLLKGKGK